MTLNQNTVPTDTTNLADLLALLEKQIKVSLNCHHVGTIQSFDAEKQTAKVQIAYKKSYLEPNDKGVYIVKDKDYPVLVDCPVVVLRGGLASLQMPIAEGDECLLLFNDRAIDTWFQGNLGAKIPNPRLHSMADGFALVGLGSIPNALSDYPTDGARIKYANSYVEVKSDSIRLVIADDSADIIALEITSDGKIAITNMTGELLSTLVDLMTDISTGTVTTLLGPQLLTMPQFAAHKAILESFKE